MENNKRYNKLLIMLFNLFKNIMSHGRIKT
jgi:hypothetical protein